MQKVLFNSIEPIYDYVQSLGSLEEKEVLNISRALEELTKEAPQLLMQREFIEIENISKENEWNLLIEKINKIKERKELQNCLENWAGSHLGKAQAKERILLFLQDPQQEVLDLRGLSLEDLPELFRYSDFHKIKVLKLSNNNFRSLPVSIGLCVNLERLDLAHNYLWTLPVTLRGCRKLEHLNASNNWLENIPASIHECASLSTLLLMNNKLRSLSFLRGCSNLRQLFVNNNLLTEIPNEVVECVNLEVLSISNNRLVEIPACLASLKHLCVLDLLDNDVSLLPKNLQKFPRTLTILSKGNPIKIVR